MRFIMFVKHAEPSGPPPEELMDAMAKLSEEAIKAGTIRGNGGLAPRRKRLECVFSLASGPIALHNLVVLRGASSVSSFQPGLPPVCRPRSILRNESWARRLTQSRELSA